MSRIFNCKRKFSVLGRSIEADNAEQAAKIYAEWWCNSFDYRDHFVVLVDDKEYIVDVTVTYAATAKSRTDTTPEPT